MSVDVTERSSGFTTGAHVRDHLNRSYTRHDQRVSASGSSERALMFRNWCPETSSQRRGGGPFLRHTPAMEIHPPASAPRCVVCQQPAVYECVLVLTAGGTHVDDWQRSIGACHDHVDRVLTRLIRAALPGLYAAVRAVPTEHGGQTS